MRITPSFSTFARPRTSRMVSSACSHVTFFREMETRPLTSSPDTMFRPLSAARIRSRLTTSASLKSSEISFSPDVGVEAGGAGGAGEGVVVAWAIIWRTGAGGAGVGETGAGAGAVVTAATTGIWAGDVGSFFTGAGTAATLSTGLAVGDHDWL